MAEVTVKELADSVGTKVDRLLVQLSEAGLPHTEADARINDEEKAQLLTYLRRMHGKSDTSEAENPRQVTLKRKSVSELKMPSSSQIGRKKTVTVEVRKRRTYAPRPAVAEEKDSASREAAEQERMEAAKRDLQEQAKRRKQELDDQLRTENEQRLAEEARRQEEERLRQEAASAAKDAPPEAPAEAPAAEAPPAVAPPPEPPADARKAARAAKKEGRGARDGRKELHVASEKSGRRRKKTPRIKSFVKPAQTQHGFEKPTAPIVHEVQIPETITIGELAQRMSVKASEVIKSFMTMGTMVTINQPVDQDTAAIVVEELGHRPKLIKTNALEDEVLQAAVPEGEGEPRAPVVTIMGHVDHGKTSLLDYIRRTKVAAGEHGGITQHIGAYQVKTEKGAVTFLDTPGHAAFTAMRARGAKSTDIVVLVVAADDGLMPQAVEAVQHAKAAKVPVVVAVNKIDKEDADPNRVQQALANHDVIPEGWGGDTQFVNVSAITGEGVDTLLESISLQAELLELSAPRDGPATGVILESRLDRGLGTVATMLVQGGTLRKGDILLAGQEYGRVRGLLDESGNNLAEAGPSVPVEVLGLSNPPEAGDEAVVLTDERKAREIAVLRKSKIRENKLALQQAATLESVFHRMEEGEVATFNVVLKADVQGSVEALREALTNLARDDAKVSIIGSGTGGISETDVNLAIASKAIIIGFNVRADSSARKLIESEGVDLHYFSVIYDVIDTVSQALDGLIVHEPKETIVGIAEVRDVFRARRYGAVAGCMVTEGVVRKSNPIRVLRENVVIYEGELESLRRFQDDVNEVKSGVECGIGVRNYNDVRVGDQIEVFDRAPSDRGT